MNQYSSDVAAVDGLHEAYVKLQDEIGKVIVGQKEVIKFTLLSIFCDSHSLLVGVPGLAKTLLIQTIANVLDLSFKRIQFTPDLMPSDILGSEILDESRHFKFNRGPLFANIVLADEINRTPPKTQAALLEAMQERKVTVSGHIHKLDLPFFVLATQNPIEQEGTYPLPEAQLDRFIFNIQLDYPSFSEEVDIVKNTTGNKVADLQKVVSKQEIIFFQQVVRKIPVADNVVEYAVRLVNKTRAQSEDAPEVIKNYLAWGAGPRASQALIMAAKAHAAINKKYSPDIEDVQAVAMPILRHRIIRNFKADAEGVSIEDIINQIL
ncbi:MAG: MoxR family ATPase [Bacteroidetes bacterium]|nr:MoxR family ATPase [Bacteroidota bacterium]